MYLFRLKAFAVTASFRIPESHTFQQSLPLPPITTLIGLMGAAVGLSFEDAIRFREEEGLRFGAIGSHQGEFKDLWKYRKIKSGEVISDILLREHLTNFEMSLYIGAETDRAVKQVRESFLSPCYVLTAGNSDALLKTREIGEVRTLDERPLSEFRNTVLPGDHATNFDPAIDLKNIPITETVRAPQVYLLPTAFNFNGVELGVRRREHFTVIGSPVDLKKPITGIEIGDETVVLI
jgi:CRISPR-associated protein Cas5t